MQARRILLALAVVLMLVLAGCGGKAGEKTADVKREDMQKVSDIAPGNGAYKFVDYEAEVVCWVYHNAGFERGQGGISCLPFSEVQGYGS